jgi:FtsP/CotA-like multicopper oxidase with cupredoxin domain
MKNPGKQNMTPRALQRTILATFFLLACATNAWAKVVEYSFNVDYKTVNFTGNNIQAMAVGGSIPAPTIEATVGDTLRVTFHNKMAVETSVHWHGILLPNDQDGVPYLTTPPIKAGTSFTFEYPVIHHGTYWYHSHTGLQEQRGVYGSIVFHPEGGERIKSDSDAVVVLSDWTDENPNRVMHNLKKSDDYYALKKDSVQSWLKVIQHGPEAIKNRIDGAWMRMGPMDISDVGYDAFLANGEKTHTLSDVKAGETVRLRVINAGASTYFNIEYAGGPMTIVAADGVDVEPFQVDRQRIAIAETFDVILTLPSSGAYEFRATSEDGTGFSSVILGEGALHKAPDIPRPNPFLMDHSMHGQHSADQSGEATGGMAMDHSKHAAMGHSMNAMEHTTDTPSQMQEYELLRSPEPTNFDAGNPRRIVNLELTGDMERYAWSFNNKVLSEDSKILIRRGETVLFVLDNKTMMHHPIHLHGHFFRVLNGQGEYSPLKHTVSVPSMQTVTIEFYANEEKDWFFHCHNLYHMKSGMTRVISYENSTQSTPNSLAPLFSDRHWFYFADLAAQTSFSNGELMAENTRNAVILEYDWDYDDEYEVELVYERSLNRFFEVYVGAEKEQEEEDEDESSAFLGLHYLLPLLIEADIRLDSEGESRLALGSELQLTDRVSFEWETNTDSEYRLQLEYEINKRFSLVGGYDDQYEWGAGFELKY